MEIAVLQRIVGAGIDSLTEHIDADTYPDAQENLDEAYRLAGIIEMCIADGSTDVRFQFEKGKRKP